MSSSSSSSSGGQVASTTINNREIDNLKAKRAFIQELLGVAQKDRKGLCQNNQVFKELKAYKTDTQLITKEESLNIEDRR